jgi:two-component system, chemotaxis family, protein-glutamate methylesterase/glutaminase
MVIKVLVVDDSSFMRKVISTMLEKDHTIKVIGTASDGLEAIEKVETLKPDVVTMDIEMPVMNGLDALRHIMAKNPLPVIIMSALTREGAEITMEAMSIGASDFVAKDHSHVSLSLRDKESELITKVKNVARNRVSFLLKRILPARKQVSVKPGPRGKHEIVSIGASTGGPPALQHVLTSFPKDFPVPVVVAQHMPRIFTQSFSQRLDAMSRIQVKEAEDGEPLMGGVALIAPGDSHLCLKRNGTKVMVELVHRSDYIYRPSVDLLMSSTARAYESRSIGVILTGMGSDGLAGLKEVRSKGGYVIAQDEETSVVYGMPKAVVNARIADVVLPIDKISEEIMRAL